MIWLYMQSKLSIYICNTTCHVMSCHVMSCHVMSCHVMSCHVMSCHVMSCHVMSCHVMSCHVMSCHVMSCHVMSCHVIQVITEVRWTASRPMLSSAQQRLGNKKTPSFCLEHLRFGASKSGDFWRFDTVLYMSNSGLTFRQASIFVAPILLKVFPECVARVPVSFGGLGVRLCSRKVVSMFATVRNRPQPFA